MFGQRAADRKRKVTTLLAGAASEDATDAVRALARALARAASHWRLHARRAAAALTQALQGAWAAPLQRGAKPLQSHDELTAEQKEYIEWHNTRREARRVRAAWRAALAAGMC